jgi:hypothetical protein
LGTLIIDDPPDSESAPVIRRLEPVMDLKDILYGSEGNSQIQKYSCTGQCLNPSTTTTNITGIYSQIKNMLLGEGVSPGLVDKMIYNTGNLTSLENAFMDLAPEHAKRLRDLVVTTRAGARIYAQSVSEIIALDMTESLIMEYVKAVQIASAASNMQLLPQFLESVRGVEMKIFTERQAVAQKMTDEGLSVSRLYTALRDGGRVNILDFDAPR